VTNLLPLKKSSKCQQLDGMDATAICPPSISIYHNRVHLKQLFQNEEPAAATITRKIPNPVISFTNDLLSKTTNRFRGSNQRAGKGIGTRIGMTSHRTRTATRGSRPGRAGAKGGGGRGGFRRGSPARAATATAGARTRRRFPRRPARRTAATAPAETGAAAAATLPPTNPTRPRRRSLRSY
jgi:hypothetical protein